METQIIILAGKSQAGKTTAAEALVKHFEHEHDIRIYNLADSLKTFCGLIFNIEPQLLWGDSDQKNTKTIVRWGDLPLDNDTYCELTTGLFQQGRPIYTNTQMTIRELLQVFGTNICRRMYPDCWVHATLTQIVQDAPEIAIIADARFPNEINFFENYDPIIIKLCRNTEDGTHTSETSLDSFDWNQLDKLSIIDNSNMSLSTKNETVIYAVLTHLSSYSLSNIYYL